MELVVWNLANTIGLKKITICASNKNLENSYNELNMRYNEYLSCAEKHLLGCNQLFSSYLRRNRQDSHVWHELYYLSGYILEGIVVYSAYKDNGWDPAVDIKHDYNLDFTQRTKLDFFYNRKIPQDKISNDYFQNRQSCDVALSVQGHRFQEIVKNLLKISPSFNDVPYIGNGEIDQDVENLIDKWGPEIRYHYLKYRNYRYCGVNLDQDIISRLLSTCHTIFSKHI